MSTPGWSPELTLSIAKGALQDTAVSWPSKSVEFKRDASVEEQEALDFFFWRAVIAESDTVTEQESEGAEK